MYQYLPIRDVYAREILDSRGNPTIEVEVLAGESVVGRASVPSGASTGKYEAVELRDKETRYGGKGVQRAVEHVNDQLAGAVIGINVFDQTEIDRTLIKTDGSTNKSNLGANALLGVSLAAAHAAARALRIPLYKYLGGVNAKKLPVPMMNILNGGAHSSNSVDVQEFMILPVGACCFREGLRWCVEVYHTLKSILKARGLSVAVGDEGGFAPDLENDEEVIQVILEAIDKAGYTYGKGEQFMISLDVAASEWKDTKHGIGQYMLPKSGERFTSDELIIHWEEMVDKYPIYSIEDPLDEEDWEGWQRLTEKIGHKVILVGDDLFVTNAERLKKGIDMKAGNAILIKPNQIGSLSETMDAVRLAKKNGFATIMSHRSGETEDTTIADLAVGLATGLIKTGAPCRGERTAKYNRLLRIEEELKSL
mgnify:CR=1 FL=1